MGSQSSSLAAKRARSLYPGNDPTFPRSTPCGGCAAQSVSGASNTVFQMEMRAPEKSAANMEYLKKRLIDFFSVCDRRLEGRFKKDRGQDEGEREPGQNRDALLRTAGGLEVAHADLRMPLRASSSTTNVRSASEG